jgi:hypothetical protein
MVSYISRTLPTLLDTLTEADYRQILWRKHLRRMLDEYTFISDSMTGLVG